MTRWCVTAAGLCLVSLAAVRNPGAIAAASPASAATGPATSGQLLISEFRVRGPAGASDEFIEIYNATDSSHTVDAAEGTGYGIAASDGVTRCSIPNGTVIPRHGHYLCVNSVGYSLASYPAGDGTTATGDASYTANILDNAGIAIFNNDAGGASYSDANRIDAVGSTAEANATYREGGGYPAITPFSTDYSITRRTVGMCVDQVCTGGSILAPISSSALVDTHDNAADFYFNDSSGIAAGFGQRLGMPGPQNLSSPIGEIVTGSSQLASQKTSGCSASGAEPNRVRDVTSDPVGNATFGTLDLRTSWKNTGFVGITRLRFRIVDLSTWPLVVGYADLRPRTSATISITTDTYPCGTGTSSTTVEGTTVETPPSQIFGSGYNGSLSVASVTAATPLGSGATVHVRFVMGVELDGAARFCVIPETLPAMAVEPYCYLGTTLTPVPTASGDLDLDRKADMPSYNPQNGQWKIRRSGTAYTEETSIFWGGPGFRAAPGDYDGDGRIDPAVYQMSTGLWSILTSSSNFTRGFSVTVFGGWGWVPQPGDYDGDKTTDITISNPAIGSWIFRPSSTTFTTAVGITWGGPEFTMVPGQDFDGDGAHDFVAYRERDAAWSVLTSSSGFTSSFSVNWGGPGYTLVPGDYNGDAQADFGVYNRRTGLWSVLLSPGYSTTLSVAQGAPGFLPMPADYDGDRRIDIAYYRPSTAQWHALTSSTSYTGFVSGTHGTPGDLPLSTAVVPSSSRELVAGDVDGDGISDVNVYNPTTGGWHTLTSNTYFTGAFNRIWGGPTYTPAPGDYDGDGKRDLGVYQPSTGNWYVLRSSAGFTTSYVFPVGGAGDIAVPGDYDGDGRTDMVVYNAATGLWSGRRSGGEFLATLSVTWGGPGFTPAPGDFDADGKTDPGVYEAATGTWSIAKSSSSYTTSIVRALGGPTQSPIPADFDGDGITDFAVHEQSSGVWTWLKSSTENTLGVTITYGGPAYTPMPGDWDGDGRADVAVYAAASGMWSILLSTGNFTTSLVRDWGGSAYAASPSFP